MSPRIIIICLLFCVFFALIMLFFVSPKEQDTWKGYIDGTIGSPLDYLYVEAKNKFFKAPGIYRAINFGSGAGNEVVDLVTRGWSVVSIDTSLRSGEVINERVKGLNGQFLFQQGDFSSVQMDGDYDFIMSFFALPFGNKKNLPVLMSLIAQHAKSGAVLAVNFFGYNHGFVKRGTAYGIDKEELLNYLKQNNFEVTFLLNRVYDQKDFEGKSIHWDVFDVIAVKI